MIVTKNTDPSAKSRRSRETGLRSAGAIRILTKILTTIHDYHQHDNRQTGPVGKTAIDRSSPTREKEAEYAYEELAQDIQRA